MKKAVIFTLLLCIPFIFAQCNQSQEGDRHYMMGEEQRTNMMQNPEQRKAIMAQMIQSPEYRQEMMNHMAENPEKRQQFMSQMHSLMNADHDHMLDQMEEMMNDPEQREQMRAHLQRMLAMLDNDQFDRGQMREMMEQSSMMEMHTNCIQMMTGSE